MSHSVQLLLDRLVNGGDTMAVNVAPQRRMPIDKAATVRINQMESFGFDDDRCLLISKGGHRSKGVPDMRVVQATEIV